jgi:hypothetical protein
MANVTINFDHPMSLDALSGMVISFPLGQLPAPRSVFVTDSSVVDQLEADKDLFLDLIAERNAELETLKRSLEEHQYLLQHFHRTSTTMYGGVKTEYYEIESHIEYEGKVRFDAHERNVFHRLHHAANNDIPRITLEAKGE